MNIILVSDIFGKTPALEKLAHELNVNTIVDPYEGKNMEFDNESEAYSYFTRYVGHEVYLNTLKECIKSSSKNCILIGFSIGATVIWRLSELAIATKIKSAICFYGSQIRNYTQISPTIDIKLVLPKSEAHFDIVELNQILSKKSRVSSTITNHLHGFMNVHSKHFSKKAYEEFMNILRKYCNC